MPDGDSYNAGTGYRAKVMEGFPIVPYEDVIYVEQAMEEKSAGGILLVGESKKVPAGIAVAVGPGRWFYAPFDATGHEGAAKFVPTQTEPGDYVVFGKYQSGGEPLIINGKRYLQCREGDLSGRSIDGKPVDVRTDPNA